MTTEKEQVRNSNGSLICDVVYDGGIWTVTVKKKDIYTFLTLYGDGNLRVENFKGVDPVKETQYCVAIPE